MKNKILLVISIILLLLCGCHSRDDVFAINNGLAEYEIIYQTTTLLENETGNSFQFGIADSSGINNRIIKIPRKDRWSVTSFLDPTSIVFPIVSGDGKNVIFRAISYPENAGNLIIYPIGDKAIECGQSNSGFDFGFWDSKRPSLLGSSELLIMYGDYNYTLSIFSFYDCGTSNIPIPIDIPNITEWGIGNGSLDRSGRFLAYTRLNEIATIVIYDSETKNEETVANGIEPVWSPDGKNLAYIGVDGIHIYEIASGMDQLVVPYLNPERGEISAIEGNWPPIVSWSPDSKWITYHKCTLNATPETSCRSLSDFSIYKLNIETGIEYNILDGGLNPYWKK